MAVSTSVVAPLSAAPATTIEAVLELNQENVTLLSALEQASLAQLIATAFRATVIGGGEAFLIAFDQDASYESPNFRWFKSRYERFVYIDRVAVAPSARGRGRARDLYRDLFDAARAAGHGLVACEVNLEPPNPSSDAFHAAQGFEEVGQARLSPGKRVRYLCREV